MGRRPVVASDDAADCTRLAHCRRLLIGVLILAVPGLLAIGTPSDQHVPVGERWFLLAGTRGSHAMANIAARLHLSPRTAANHLSAAIQKRSARNPAEAAQIAQQKGWL